MVKPEAQPVEKQKPEDPQVSEEPVLEPSSSEQKLDSQPEPTVTFLFTLLSTAEPTESKDPEKASDIQECQFLDKEDWGPRRTSREISHLQNDCRRLRESLSTIQADNRALREKLQNLLTVSYGSLKREAKAFLEEVKAAPEDARAFPEDAQAIPGMALSQQLSSQKAALFIPQPAAPMTRRYQYQPWQGPRLETRHFLGKPFQELLSRSQ